MGVIRGVIPAVFCVSSGGGASFPSSWQDSAERANGDIGRECMTMHRVYYSNGLFTIGYENAKGVMTQTIGSARMEEAA